MCEHNLCYIDGLEVPKGKMSKGCIAIMVTRRKVKIVSNFVFFNDNLTTLTKFYLFITGKENFNMWFRQAPNDNNKSEIKRRNYKRK